MKVTYMQTIWRIIRYMLRSLWNHCHVRTMVYICFISTAVSSGALTMIAAIMEGFESHTYACLKSLHPDVSITLSQKEDIHQITSYYHLFHDTSIAISPYAIQHAVVYHPKLHRFQAVTCYGIDPSKEQKTTALERMIIQPQDGHLENIMKEPGIVLGSSLAAYLCVTPGDTIYLGYHAPEADEDAIAYTSVCIGGIYETGIEEQDRYLIYTSHETYESIWEACPVQHIGASIPDTYTQQDVHMICSTYIPTHANVSRWHDAYPALMSALRLEKYATIAVMTLLLMLAGISSMTLAYMIIYMQLKTCSILYAMGMRRSTIQRACFISFISFSAIASGFGILTAACLSWIMNTYHLIPVPEAYGMSYLPAHISCSLLLTIWLIALCIHIATAWVPRRFISRISPGHILQSEG